MHRHILRKLSVGLKFNPTNADGDVENSGKHVGLAVYWIKEIHSIQKQVIIGYRYSRKRVYCHVISEKTTF